MNKISMDDKEFMNKAFKEAQKAYERGEAPVGALIVQNGNIIAGDGNREIELYDPTAHAEILVLRKAGQLLGQHTFPDCTVYTTLWPCPMCEAALLRAKIENVVCGAHSFKYIPAARDGTKRRTTPEQRVSPMTNTIENGMIFLEVDKNEKNRRIDK